MCELHTSARIDVLEFYKQLPFNSMEDPGAIAELIKQKNSVKNIYPNITRCAS